MKYPRFQYEYESWRAGRHFSLFFDKSVRSGMAIIFLGADPKSFFYNLYTNTKINDR